jgi:hypothetical protein
VRVSIHKGETTIENEVGTTCLPAIPRNPTPQQIARYLAEGIDFVIGGRVRASSIPLKDFPHEKWPISQAIAYDTGEPLEVAIIG